MEIKKYPVLKWLFKHYQEGSLDQQKKELIDEWFALYYTGEPVNLLNNPETEQRVYRELNERLTQAMHPAPVYRLWRPRTWLKMACLFLAVMLPVLYFYPPRPKHQLEIADYQTITTANKQIKNIALDDGTEIWLNSATRIRIPQSFKTEKNRVVYLDRGEAFFQVKHDASRQFSVISGDLITRDIGTSFNIRAYDLKNEYRVGVVSGSVAVLSKNRTGVVQTISAGLTKEQLLVYATATHKVTIIHRNSGLIGPWKSGNSLYFDGFTLTQIGEELSRHYNIRVTVTYPERDPSKYIIRFGNQSLQKTLQQLTLKTGISYRLEPNSLTLFPKIN